MIIAIGLGAAAFLIPASRGWAAQPDPVAFSIGIELGDVQQASRWLDEGLSPDFLGSRIGSGLMIGAWEGNLPVMQLFLGRGAKIDLANANGETPIALAAWRGNLDAVKWLLERGARINASGKQWSALHYAVFAGHKPVVDYLLAQGADINALSTNGSSPLMMAVYEGRDEIARVLIQRGADRSIRNDWGDNALDWAMRFERLGIAREIGTPEEFTAAVAKPKESWGPAVRSQQASKELERLLNARAILAERGMSVTNIDRWIATERARIARAELDRLRRPTRTTAVEVSANRRNPTDQKAQIVTDEKGKSSGFKAPPATYYGTPKMPPKGNNLRNY